MTSVGDTLRRERLQRNLDLDSISHELKISRRLLDAIEADQYELLPGSMFAKAFVRQYADLLGLDGEALAAQVQRAVEPPALASNEKARPDVNPIEVPRVEEWNSVGDKGFRLSGSLPAAVLVVVVMLICSAVYAWMQRPRYQAAAHTTAQAPVRTAPAAQPAAPAPETATATPSPAGETPGQGAAAPLNPISAPPANAAAAPPNPAPIAPAETPAAQPASPATSAAAAPATPTAPGPVHVELVADETVWVLARVDGKFAFTGTMEANARRVLDGNKEVLLRLGNAGGVTILLNGKSIGPPGPKGQVRTLQLTSGGFQIVPAKPPEPAVPLDR